VISKKKIDLDPSIDFNDILTAIKNNFSGYNFDERDGLWIETESGWVQVRKSNTEPIMRIYSEAGTVFAAESLADKVIETVKKS
jgi:phosphomannomutase